MPQDSASFLAILLTSSLKAQVAKFIVGFSLFLSTCISQLAYGQSAWKLLGEGGKAVQVPTASMCLCFGGKRSISVSRGCGAKQMHISMPALPLSSLLCSKLLSFGSLSFSNPWNRDDTGVYLGELVCDLTWPWLGSSWGSSWPWRALGMRLIIQVYYFNFSYLKVQRKSRRKKTNLFENPG